MVKFLSMTPRTTTSGTGSHVVEILRTMVTPVRGPWAEMVLLKPGRLGIGLVETQNLDNIRVRGGLRAIRVESLVTTKNRSNKLLQGLHSKHIPNLIRVLQRFQIAWFQRGTWSSRIVIHQALRTRATNFKAWRI
ncbi:hypothetical protein VNO77_22616 [Canavalia gladiata]|uniref:Uncharacterized protein n=1 Tax=Canavalia gladiata TaxID=3824 RepID=A0AAN9L5I5_CANGL